MAILAGDIGGTHTRLALAGLTVAADQASPRIQWLARANYLNAEATDLYSLVDRFLAGHPRPRAACLAVAGPTDGHRARLTNLPWDLDADQLMDRFNLPSARLVNDFEAVGHGLEALAPTDLHVLQAGQAQPGAPRLALGPGTGLGVVQCLECAGRYRPVPSEGGHIAFAPVDAEQADLLAFLQREHGRVSVERLLSGPGLLAIHRFCGGRGDDPAAVSRAALAEDAPAARRALGLFCRILGQTAGDLALVSRAGGGVYLAGGIAPAILPALQAGGFLAGFRAKGRFSDWMATLPVQVILDPEVGLKGAALAAERPAP